jgi:hypothetical protein
METAMVHRVGDIEMIEKHITMLDSDRALLERLRATALRMVPEITWGAAGIKLLQVYRDVIESKERYKAN